MGWPFAPPPDLSHDGYRVTSLFWYATGATAVAFGLVAASLAIILLRFRSSRSPKPASFAGNSILALVATLALSGLVFVFIDGVLASRSQKSMSEYLYNWPTTKDALRIEVMARQWAWSFRYAGDDGLFNTPDDVVTLNELWLPKGRPVFLNLASKDVIHAFYVPQFRIKQDIIPGRITKLWFQADQTGDIEVACSQICGWAHYKMRATGRVLPASEFAVWYREAQEDARRRFDPQDRGSLWGWEWIAR